MATGPTPHMMTLIFSKSLLINIFISLTGIFSRKGLWYISVRGKIVGASVTMEMAKHLLLSFGIILAVGTFGGFLYQKIKVPDVAIFLVVGMLLGHAVTGLINITAESAVNQIIILFGACYILFDGGASIKLKILKEVWITLTMIATIGVLISAAITGRAAHYALGLPSTVALLLGATIASTDPATIVPILRQVKIKGRVSQTVTSDGLE